MNIPILNRHGPGRRSGSSTVEFALVAPLFFVFLIGTIEMGRLAMAKNVMTNASREAARAAIVDGATPDSVEEIARTYAAVGSIDNVTVLVSPTDFNNSSETLIRVTVEAPFDEISWFPAPFFMKNTIISATTIMRKENFDVSTYNASDIELPPYHEQPEEGEGGDGGDD